MPIAAAATQTSTRLTRLVPFRARLMISTARAWLTSAPRNAAVSTLWPSEVRTNTR